MTTTEKGSSNICNVCNISTLNSVGNLSDIRGNKTTIQASSMEGLTSYLYIADCFCSWKSSKWSILATYPHPTIDQTLGVSHWAWPPIFRWSALAILSAYSVVDGESRRCSEQPRSHLEVGLGHHGSPRAKQCSIEPFISSSRWRAGSCPPARIAPWKWPKRNSRHAVISYTGKRMDRNHFFRHGLLKRRKWLWPQYLPSPTHDILGGW